MHDHIINAGTNAGRETLVAQKRGDRASIADRLLRDVIKILQRHPRSSCGLYRDQCLADDLAGRLHGVKLRRSFSGDGFVLFAESHDVSLMRNEAHGPRKGTVGLGSGVLDGYLPRALRVTSLISSTLPSALMLITASP